MTDKDTKISSSTSPPPQPEEDQSISTSPIPHEALVIPIESKHVPAMTILAESAALELVLRTTAKYHRVIKRAFAPPPLPPPKPSPHNLPTQEELQLQQEPKKKKGGKKRKRGDGEEDQEYMEKYYNPVQKLMIDMIEQEYGHNSLPESTPIVANGGKNALISIQFMNLHAKGLLFGTVFFLGVLVWLVQKAIASKKRVKVK